MKVLFLDVDGVLNSIEHITASRNLCGMAPFHVTQLARLICCCKSRPSMRPRLP